MRDTIYFLPENATLTITYTGPGIDPTCGVSGARLRLRLDARVTNGDRVQYPTHEGRQQLRTRQDAIWNVELLDADTYNDRSDERGSIGYFRAHRQQVSVCLTRENFAKLQSVLEHGYLPERIWIEVEGLQFGWEFDGKDVVWDLAAEGDEPIPIFSVGIDIPVSGPVSPLVPAPRPAPSGSRVFWSVTGWVFVALFLIVIVGKLVRYLQS